MRRNDRTLVYAAGPVSPEAGMVRANDSCFHGAREAHPQISRFKVKLDTSNHCRSAVVLPAAFGLEGRVVNSGVGL